MKRQALLLVRSQCDYVRERRETETKAGAGGHPDVRDCSCRPRIDAGPGDLSDDSLCAAVVDGNASEGLIVPAATEAVDGTGCWLREGDAWSWLESELRGLAHC